jgi:uncharacterized protein (DUF433 family)
MSSVLTDCRTEDFSFRHSRQRPDDRWFEDSHEGECDVSGKDFSLPFATALRKALESFPLIAMDGNVLFGTPRIAGTRIPVHMVLDAVAYYGTVQGVFVSYPQLTAEQVKEALSFAGAVLEQPVEHESEAFTR